jgi:hypothetical protein
MINVFIARFDVVLRFAVAQRKRLIDRFDAVDLVGVQVTCKTGAVAR